MARPLPHDDALRATLVELASQAVADGGVQALSLRSVAAGARTTTAAIYTLFGGRDGLVRAVVDEAFRRFAAHLDAVPRTDDPGADLLALGIAYRANATTNPHFYRVMFGAGPSGQPPVGLPAVAQPTFAALREAVARLPQGSPHASGDPEAVALRLWALVHGLVSLELAGLLPGTPAEHAARYRAALIGPP